MCPTFIDSDFPGRKAATAHASHPHSPGLIVPSAGAGTHRESVSERARPPWITLQVSVVAWQVAVVVLVSIVVTIVAKTTAANLGARGIASGYDYLTRAAGFEISQGLLSYSSRDTYGRAVLVGLANTIRLSLLGIVGATALGVLVGIAQVSPLWIARTAGRVYVEAARNTPLLLQLLFWYSLWRQLPGSDAALSPLPGVFLSARGLFLPRLIGHAGLPWFALDRPSLVGFDFRGGISISPEFGTLLVGLTLYTAAFIAEIVRGGIVSVDRGQTEAAAALGLSELRILRLVILPQALPAIVPPTISQFLNLAKNSSLAIAIGYPDLLSITNTTVNQTGQAIEAFALAAACYLAVSLAVSIAANASAGALRARLGRGALHVG